MPASARTVVDADGFGQLTAYDTRRAVYGTERRAILTNSPSCTSIKPAARRHHAGQGRRQLDELSATLARGKTRRARGKVEAEIAKLALTPGSAASSPGS